MAASLMSKLDAVNKMLESVWEQPVSTLQISGVASVAMAQRVLDETTTTVQTRGWAFNTEENFLLMPDANGFINLPNNTLEVETMGVDVLTQAIMRGTQLYDRVNHTFVFPLGKGLNVRIIYLFPFETLPQVARYFIATMASRVFRDQFQQKDTSSPATAAEMEAFRDLEEYEGMTNHGNMFTDSQSMQDIVERLY